jgi:hypothetical protein
MKRLSVLLLALVVACAPAQTKADLVAPTVANDFFAALCAEDAHYLATHTGGALAGVSEEYLTDYFASMTKQCTGFRYLGSLTPEPGIEQYVFVMSWGPDGELWYVITVEDGVVVNVE